jgi:hypothetical protein
MRRFGDKEPERTIYLSVSIYLTMLARTSRSHHPLTTLARCLAEVRQSIAFQLFGVLVYSSSCGSS